MNIPELWFKITQWLTKQGKNQIIIFLFSFVITLLLLENYNLRNENVRLFDNHTADNNRRDSNEAIIEKRLQDCMEKRHQDLENANKYWAKKYEKLEERLYEDYKNIKKIRQK